LLATHSAATALDHAGTSDEHDDSGQAAGDDGPHHGALPFNVGTCGCARLSALISQNVKDPRKTVATNTNLSSWFLITRSA
jgi:hypothetical protein